MTDRTRGILEEMVKRYEAKRGIKPNDTSGNRPITPKAA